MKWSKTGYEGRTTLDIVQDMRGDIVEFDDADHAIEFFTNQRARLAAVEAIKKARI